MSLTDTSTMMNGRLPLVAPISRSVRGRAHTRTFGLKAAALGLALVSGLAGLSGCRGERSEDPPRQFFPDMDDAPKWKPQTKSPFFEDGRTMRPAVTGTVAFGERVNATPEQRAGYLREDQGFYEGIDLTLWNAAKADYDAKQAVPVPVPASAPASANGDHAAAAPAAPAPAAAAQPAFPGQADVYLAYMPITPDEKIIARGRDRFNIYCATCHGFRGEGSDPGQSGSTVGLRWSTPVPSYHDPKYLDRAQRTGKDGYIFHTARHGVVNADPTKPPTMPSYAHALSEEDTWAVVAYIRVLQTMWTSDLNSVPMSDIKGQRPASPPPPPPAVPAPAAAPGAGQPAPAAQPKVDAGAPTQGTVPTPSLPTAPTAPQTGGAQ